MENQHESLKALMTAKEVVETIKQVLGDEHARIMVIKTWCKSCGICVQFCPRHCLEMAEDNYPRLISNEACTNCGTCEFMCPDLAIIALDLKRKK